jgi:uncharacterized protein with HEPN domain
MVNDIERNKLRLLHILEAIDAANDFLVDVSKEEFDNNYEKQSAVIRQFEIIGEAASHLAPDFKKDHSDIDWAKVVGMRHKMIHDYFEVDTDIVWFTVAEDLPGLQQKIKKILEKM